MYVNVFIDNVIYGGLKLESSFQNVDWFCSFIIFISKKYSCITAIYAKVSAPYCECDSGNLNIGVVKRGQGWEQSPPECPVFYI